MPAMRDQRRLRLFAALGWLLGPALLPAQDSLPRWTLGGTPNAGYVMTATSGSATDRRGAALGLRGDSVAAGAFGSISGSIPADSFRGRRVRIVGDIDTKNVTGGASPWLRVDGPGGRLAFDNGSDDAVKGTTTGHREITLFVPAPATKLVFGLLLTGRGEATVRNLRIETLPTVAANTPLSPVAKRELDSAIALVRAHSLWRDTVSWPSVEADVRAAAAGARTATDVYPAIQQLLARLGDHHSFLMKPTATQQFRTGGAANPRPVIRALPDGMGYISVPAYSGAEHGALVAYAKSVQDSLAAILPQTSCRWVVDLRGNGGGNMWPMLGGLRPFLGDVGLGSFATAAGNDPLWHASDAVDVRPTPALAALESSYVAVLTGPRTASSGEAVTISFIARPHTRSFGLPTAGLSTANENYALPSGSMILLTVSVEADRTGRRYGEKITPDEVIEAASPGSADDPQLARAVAWLQAQPGCAVPRP